MTDKTAMNFGTIAAALIGLAAIVWVWRLGRRKITFVPLVIALIALITTGFLFWYTHRPLSPNINGEIFSGITYSREVLDGPIIVYTVRVDLHAPGIRFMVTPNEATGSYALPARTTS